MDLSALRRAFRTRPGTTHSTEFTTFLAGLETNERGWQKLVSLLEKDVIPVVSRCHPATESDEIWSTCLTGAFESWVSEWLRHFHAVARVRRLLAQERHDEAFAALTDHPRFRGKRAETARTLWRSRRWDDSVSLIKGTQSARSHFIAQTRAQIRESQRRQRRQSRLMSRHCSDTSGIAASGGQPSMATQAARSLCGAKIASRSGAIRGGSPFCLRHICSARSWPVACGRCSAPSKNWDPNTRAYSSSCWRGSLSAALPKSKAAIRLPFLAAFATCRNSVECSCSSNRRSARIVGRQ